MSELQQKMQEALAARKAAVARVLGGLVLIEDLAVGRDCHPRTVVNWARRHGLKIYYVNRKPALDVEAARAAQRGEQTQQRRRGRPQKRRYRDRDGRYAPAP